MNIEDRILKLIKIDKISKLVFVISTIIAIASIIGLWLLPEPACFIVAFIGNVVVWASVVIQHKLREEIIKIGTTNKDRRM